MGVWPFNIEYPSVRTGCESDLSTEEFEETQHWNRG